MPAQATLINHMLLDAAIICMLLIFLEQHSKVFFLFFVPCKHHNSRFVHDLSCCKFKLIFDNIDIHLQIELFHQWPRSQQWSTLESRSPSSLSHDWYWDWTADRRNHRWLHHLNQFLPTFRHQTRCCIALQSGRRYCIGFIRTMRDFLPWPTSHGGN